ncbi:MAG: DUF202 domain-containing protein [Aequorivita sp.]|nr:DUF202 domain-containing protein [Aequorivita sp.]
MKENSKKLFRFLRTQPLPENTNEILALERTKLANERTLLAYIRASLYLMLGGIAILQLKDFNNIHWIGYAALVISVVFIAVGFFRYILLMRRLYKWNRILYLDSKTEKSHQHSDTEEKMQKEEAEA